jgi:nucleotide-binding universal stress UspA family protein
MQPKRLLVPVDLSSSSFDALRFARQMAMELSVQVTLLNVVNLNVPIPEGRVYNELFWEAREGLRKLGERFFGGSPAVNLRVRLGRPHEQIIAEADAELSELIIMTGPKPKRWRWLFGHGTVGKVIRKAPCPTLVMPCD